MTAGTDLGSLIAGCKRMDANSQMTLYRLFYSYGMSICLRYAKNRESAQEMLNDGFLKVFQNIDQYKIKKPFKPWLRQIMINAAIDHFRKYKEEIIFDNYKQAPTEHSYNEALDKLAYDDLLPLIQGLPKAYQMVFNMYVIDGLSHQAIAKKLGISIGTSKSNLSKARQKLRASMVNSAWCNPQTQLIWRTTTLIKK